MGWHGRPVRPGCAGVNLDTCVSGPGARLVRTKLMLMRSNYVLDAAVDAVQCTCLRYNMKCQAGDRKKRKRWPKPWKNFVKVDSSLYCF